MSLHSSLSFALRHTWKLPMSLCDHNCVILLTNRARCTSYKILDLLDEESVMERTVVELVSMRSLPCSVGAVEAYGRI